MTRAASFEFVEGATSDLAFVARGASCDEALRSAALVEWFLAQSTPLDP